MITQNLNILANNLMNLSKSVELNARDLVRKCAIGISVNVIMATPVDTGRARANWQVSLRNPLDNELEDTDKNGSNTVSKATRVCVIFELRDQSINIANNLPYINRLNNGWSKQANAGYIERAISGVHFDIKNANLVKRRGQFYAKG